MGSGNWSLISNLATQQLYALADSHLSPLLGPGTVANLLPLDADSGAVSGSKVALSQSVFLDFGSGIFAGYNRLVLVDGATLQAFSVDPRSGAVSQLASALSRWLVGDGWATWGVAEQVGGQDVRIVYGAFDGTVERQQLYAEGLLDSVFASRLGAVSSLTLDIPSSRWFYYVASSSPAFGNHSLAVGCATAHFAQSSPSHQPTATPTTAPTTPTAQPSSQPSSVPTGSGFGDGLFFVTSLSSAHRSVANVSAFTRVSHGGLALSATKVFVAGESQTIGVQKSDLSLSDPAVISSGNWSLVSNLATQQLYALADSHLSPLLGPGTVANLLPLDSDSGAVISGAKTVSLSESVFLSFGSGIFSGWNRLVLVDRITTFAFSVDPRSGKVQGLQSAIVRWHSGAGWAVWGVAEYSLGAQVSILYAVSSGGVERQNLFADNDLSDLDASGLSPGTSLTVDTALHRWYFYQAGADGSETLGFADAGFANAFPTSRPSSQPSMQPTSQPSDQPTSQPSSQPTGQPTSLPSLQPIGVPSAEPSSQPSSQPTSQPSAQPTSHPSPAPSPHPSPAPTPVPSGAPSKAPTVTKTAVTFNVTQGVEGITKAAFELDLSLFKKVVIAAMTGVDTSKIVITITKVTPIEAVRRALTDEEAQRWSRLLAVVLNSLSVEYRVDFILQDFDYPTPPVAYGNLTNNLRNTIVLGNFTTALVRAAVAQAAQLNVTSPFVNITRVVLPTEAPISPFAFVVFNSTMEPSVQPTQRPSTRKMFSVCTLCLFDFCFVFFQLRQLCTVLCLKSFPSRTLSQKTRSLSRSPSTPRLWA